jgi:serine protease Do
MRRLISALALSALMSVAVGVLAQEVDLNEQTERAMARAVEKVGPCVVAIDTSGGAAFVGGPGGKLRKGEGSTSGLIVSADGYIISSAFNFANKPSAINVVVPGRAERYAAKVVATDTTRQVTLLKIDATDLPVPTPLPRQQMQVGQWTLALGRTLAPTAERPSVSVGIVSALDRIWGKAVQTDAKISPVNYGGALVDISGRVYGVIVPAAPRGDSEVAGVEWYDSGIGFAMYLEDILAALPRLKAGKDLRRAVLGIEPPGADQFLPESRKVGKVKPDSPADKAGIKPGDLIEAVDGKAVRNFVQILMILGRKYEGDKVSLTLRRDGQAIELTDIELFAPATGHQQGFVGILPLRDDATGGVELRYVFPKSPADQAGLKPGDRLVKIDPTGTGALKAGPQPLKGQDALTTMVGRLRPGAELVVEVQRPGAAPEKTERISLKLAPFDPAIPEQLPPVSSRKQALAVAKQAKAKAKDPDAAQPDDPPAEPKPAEKVETGLIRRKLAAQGREFWAYVPPNYDPNIAHGLVLWLHGPDRNDREADDLTKVWGPFCAERHLILFGPRSTNPEGFNAGDLDAILQDVQGLLDTYTIDRRRVVAHGFASGGQMAYYLGFNARELVRGVATVGAVLAPPTRDHEVGERLAFFIAAGGKDPDAKAIEQVVQPLRDRFFPVIFRQMPELGREYLDRKTLEELVRWIDSLDRL